MSESLEVAQSVIDIMQGPDGKDATALKDVSMLSCESFVEPGTSPPCLRFGAPSEYFVGGMHDSVIEAWSDGLSALRLRHHEVAACSLPLTRYSVPTYYTIALAEAASNLSRYDGIRYGGSDFGHTVRRRISAGNLMLAEGAFGKYLSAANRVRRGLQDEFSAAFERFDALIFPTVPSPPESMHGHNDSGLDVIKDCVGDVCTVGVSLAGLPSVSVPVSDGLGLQVIAASGRDDIAFLAAKELWAALEISKSE